MSSPPNLPDLPKSDIANFDLPAIRSVALELVGVGELMPPPDADEDETGLWLIKTSFVLVRLERLLNPRKLPFADRDRTLFTGPDPAFKLRALRGSVDRILRALQFEDVACKAYPSGVSGEYLEGPTASFPSDAGLTRIQPADWERLGKLAKALPEEKPQSQPTETANDSSRDATILLDAADTEVLRIASDPITRGEDKMLAILRIDSRYEAKKSTWWAGILGVKDATIRGYGTWKRIQAGKRNPD